MWESLITSVINCQMLWKFVISLELREKEKSLKIVKIQFKKVRLLKSVRNVYILCIEIAKKMSKVIVIKNLYIKPHKRPII